MATKRLKWEDMKPPGLDRELHDYTDEDARKHGYPSLKVMKLEYELTRIAGSWRVSKRDSLVYEYKSVLYEMILNGYDVDTLPIQDQLPPELMPELPPPRVQAAIKQVYETQ
jgi:hypothetical protein